MIVLAILIVVLYCLSMLFIFLFSLGQLHLTWYYLKGKREGKKEVPAEIIIGEGDLPFVTVQLPLYNEKYVVERLLKAITSLDYPGEKLQIQVLDDSTDSSVELAKNEIKKYQDAGVNITHITRNSREGYKAGALSYGLTQATGEFIAIFDADFIPEKDFLKKTIPYFNNEKVGVVQTRWGHLNRNYSILTKLQAFGLDAHFSVEQSGRSAAGSFINFNGTGGVWRRRCIDDAGGWSDDTLTEDLDLSYRAQLKGWKFIFTEDYEAPAELPVIMPAIKSQQYRWNKGAAETARKHIMNVFQKDISNVTKFHAFFHLFNSSIFICLLAGAVLSVPMIFIKDAYPQLDILFYLGSFFIAGFLSIALFYWVAAKRMFAGNTFKYFWSLFPAFLTVSMGLSFHNSIAVVQGLFGKKSEFVRTPKFNILKEKDSWRGNDYVRMKLDFTTIMEGFLSLYVIFGIISGIMLNDWALMIFHFMLALGFALVFLYSVKALRNA